MHCPSCGEEYSLGQKLSRGAFHHWPDGEYAYWEHASTSQRHAMLSDAQDHVRTELLQALPVALANARTHQKLMRNPTLTPLRELFR